MYLSEDYKPNNKPNVVNIVAVAWIVLKATTTALNYTFEIDNEHLIYTHLNC